MTLPLRSARRRTSTAWALAFLLSLSAATMAQVPVEGVVLDAATGEPLIGASIVIDGTSTGASTGINGSYAFTVAPGSYLLRASYIGYEPQTLEISARQGLTTTASFDLEADLTGIEEVVVTGALSSRSRSRSEVAVSRINAEDLQEVNSYQDISQLLSGKVAGVSVQPSSGNVGGGIRFNVRGGGGLNGDGQPLIFVDGVRVNNDAIGGNEGAFGVGGQQVGALSDLNPDDIAAIDVLKGPAASALYGTDASNGVVLITTKKGSFQGAAAQPFQVSYSTTVGQNAQQFEYDERTAGATAADANAIFQDGAIQQHTLGLSGGSSTVRYFTQFDTRDEDGIVFGNFQSRRALRANFEAFPIPNLSLGANTSYTFNTVGSPQNDNNILGYLGNTLLFPRSYQFTDSAAVRAIETGFKTNRFVGSLDARYTPIPGLSLQATVGVDALGARQDQTFPANFVYSARPAGERNIFTRQNEQISFQADARYRYRPAAGLNATTAFGVQGFDQRSRQYFFRIRDFATPLITDAGAGETYQTSGEVFLNDRQFGLIAEQSLDYADTYFLTTGLRNDYASSIGNDAPSIFYPMVRGAVRLDRFDAAPSLFSLLKVRAAYGESGQLPGSFDGIPVLYSAEVGGSGAGAVPISIGNPSIQPERVSEFETGLDFELADRIGVEFTYYRQRSEDSIFDVALVPSSGLVASERPTNVGEIQSQGLELSLNATPLATRSAVLTLSAVVSHQTNEVIDIGQDQGSQPLFDGFDLNVIAPGLPRAAFYTRPVNGALFDDDGVYAGVDAGVRTTIEGGEVADGCSLQDDRCLFGTPYPDWNGSFTASLTLFQDLTIYALADWATGISIFNNTDVFRAQFGNYNQRNDLADQLGLTTVENDDGTLDTGDLADLSPGTPEYQDAADAYARTDFRFDANFVSPADFIKLRELSVRYDIGRLLARAPGFSGVRKAAVAVSGRNLFQSSLYSGLDPEVNFAGSRSLSRGQDFLTLQNPRVVTVTLQLGL